MDKLPVIPGYTIEKEIGRSSVSRVYLAKHEILGKEVALKVLIDDYKLIKMFFNEAQMLVTLTHSNTIRMYDVGTTENHMYYHSLEFFPSNLSDRIKNSGKLKPKKALKIIMSIADTLDHLHEEGIVHRNIKPSKIMFRKDETPVLAGFGIAMYKGFETRLTKTGKSIGTPIYMSPEHSREDLLDIRSDIYSLGVVLYEMLTGKVPFDVNDCYVIGDSHFQEPIPELPADLSKYQELVNKMMAKNPDDRPATGKELMGFIQPILPLPESFFSRFFSYFKKRD